VRPERFELPTYCSGGNRSIHLSYGRTVNSFSLHAQFGSINVNHHASACCVSQQRYHLEGSAGGRPGRRNER
jgi:hypothetical protein